MTLPGTFGWYRNGRKARLLLGGAAFCLTQPIGDLLIGVAIVLDGEI